MASRIYSAGQLKHQLQFQQRAPGDDDLGNRAGAWQHLNAPVLAAHFPVRGSERMQAGAEVQQLDALFVIRARDWVTPQLRALWKGVPYEITAVVPVDDGWLELSTYTGAKDGRQL